MTGPMESKGDRSRDQLLAGEYVLGVLSPEARRHVEIRISRDRSFARMVSHWQRNLSTLEEDYLPERPQLFMPPPRRMTVSQLGSGNLGGFMRRAWSSLLLWRSVALVSLAVLLTYLVL